ncbi:LacI family DNA-binding transcriptional regulator [uncultured Victivallis sp.]|uniref:LacI family DNA-binding transcriptional regulator n=1 Tax=uncultured Victivallis sp. TaxID=354118 RepID=UPI00258DC315|nr:LacI family DNA-binding transcriptional regulator [uncultured Victivallis sp.]
MNSLKKKITLADVAREVGCSKSAVSYAILRNHPVSEELRQKIFEAIERLGYLPYGSQRRSSRKVVILLSDTWVSTREITLFQEKLQEHGLLCQQCLLPRYKESLSNQEEFYRFLNHNPQVAGIISLHPDLNSFDLIRRCKNIPTTIFCRESSMLSYSVVRLEAISRLAVSHILRLNQQRVAFVMLDEPTPYAHRIFEVMCSDPRLAGSGILLEPFMLHSDELATPSLPFSRLDASWADGVRIFLTNSVVLALPILQWAYSRRLHIPEDLSLFAIDYAEEGALCVPPLTTVALPLAKLVELTIDELLCRIAGKPFSPVTLVPSLIDRGSTYVCEK